MTPANRLALLLSILVLAAAVPASAQLPPEYQAAGHPIFNCDQERARAVKLSRGLEGLDDKIRRTEKQLDAAKAGQRDPEQAKQQAGAVHDLPIDVALILTKTNEFEALLKQANLRPAAMGRIESVLTAMRGPKNVAGAPGGLWEVAYKNPNAMVDLARANSDSMLQGAVAIHRLLVDTGSYQKVAEIAIENAVAAGTLAPLTETAAALIGPVGELTLATGVFAIDTMYADGLSFQNAIDEANAAGTLNALTGAKNDIMQSIEDVVQYCGARDAQATKDSPKSTQTKDTAPTPTPAPTPAPPATPPPAQKQAKSGGMSKPLAVTLLAGTGALVGLKAAAANVATDTANSGGSSSGGSSSATYRVLATHSCTPGIFTDAPGVPASCSGPGSNGSCDPANFVVTVTNGLLTDACGWLSTASVASGSYSGIYHGYSGGGVPVNGAFNATGTSSLSGDGPYEGNNNTSVDHVRLTITRQ